MHKHVMVGAREKLHSKRKLGSMPNLGRPFRLQLATFGNLIGDAPLFRAHARGRTSMLLRLRLVGP